MRNQESGCGFRDQITEFIYGELNDAERERFSNHLESCKACPGEIDSLKSVIGAIGEWKSNVFDPMESPGITVPTAVMTEPAAAEASAWHRFREIFSFSPLMLKAAAGFAAILVAAGIFWISLDYAADPDIAGKVPAPDTIKIDVQNERPELAENRKNEEDDQVTDEATPESVLLKGEPAEKPVRVSNRIDDDVVRRKTIRKPLKPKKKPGKTPEKQNSPSVKPLDDDEESIPPVNRLTVLADSVETEDDGLRLTELFAIVDSDER